MKIGHWAIIGRGIIGLTAAFRLLQAGYLVTVIGPAKRDGTGSAAALGNFTVKGLVLNDNGSISAKIHGQYYLRQMVDELERETGIIIPKIRGIYEVFEDANALARLRQRIYHNNFSALFSYETLNAGQTEERCKFLQRYGSLGREGGSLFYPNDFWIDPGALLDALEAAITKRSGQVIDGSVHSIRLQDSQKIVIESDHSKIVVDDVLIAAGIHSNCILAAANLPPLPLFESPGETFSVSVADAPTGAITVGRKGMRVWDSTLRFGSYDLEGAQIDQNILNRFDSNGFVSQIMGRILPSLGESKIIRKIRGTRSFTKDRLPVFGSYNPFLGFPERRLWLATAFYKTGFYLADYCAQNFIKSLQNQIVEPYYTQMSPTRFKVCLNV